MCQFENLKMGTVIRKNEDTNFMKKTGTDLQIIFEEIKGAILKINSKRKTEINSNY
jgi:hypothetical protein